MDNSIITDRFWASVDTLKKQKGMTWETLAKEIGTTPNSLAAMKNSRKNPSIAYAYAIAQALNVTLDSLCSDSTPDQEKKINDSTAKDVLDVLCEKLSTRDMLSLILLAEQMRELNSADSGDYSIVDESKEGDTQDKFLESLKKRYL